MKKKFKIDKITIGIFSFVLLILTLIFNPIFYSIDFNTNLFEVFNNVDSFLYFNTKSVILSFGVLILIILQTILSSNKKQEYKGVEQGSASFSTAQKMLKFANEKPQKNIIISQNIRLNRDFHVSNPDNNRNKNVCVKGSSGSGKTRFYVKPNLMQLYGTYIVTDPKQTLFDETSKMFLDHDYDVRVFNLKDLSLSMKYNPFAYIHSELDILEFVNSLMENTKGEGQKSGEDFWVNAERMYFQSLIGYIFEVHDESEQNMNTLLNYINRSDENGLDEMFSNLESISKDSFAVRMYKKFKVGAENTTKSILISVSARTSMFDIQEIRDLLSYDEMDLYNIGNKNVILYVILKDYDRTLNFISSIMYKQLFRILMTQADFLPNGRFPYPCQFLLDEFATSGKIPDFETIINNIRSRNISATIMIQDDAQLKKMYGDDANSIVSACDSIVFLGTANPDTAKKISDELGNTTVKYDSNNRSYERNMMKSYSKNENQTSRALMTNNEVSELDNNKLIYRLRGVKPVVDYKFELESHKNYNYLLDFNPSQKNDLYSFINKKKTEKKVEESFVLDYSKYEKHKIEEINVDMVS